MNMRKRWIRWAPLAVAGLLVFIGVGGAAVQLLWNWLMPSLFAWHAITFWQAIGLLALCRILFGGFGRHGFPRRHMSPEERERFHQRMR
jgi:hypothetical protein